jgi:hypothetical protein
MSDHARDVRAAMGRILGRAWLVALAWACVPAVGTDEPEGEGDGAATPSAIEPAEAAAPHDGPLELSLDGAPAQRVAEVLPRASGRDLAPAHAERTGWSSDARTFVHCRRLPGVDCTECRSIGRDGTVESLESGPACGDRAVPSTTIDARLAALALTPGPSRWPAGADVVLVVETREHEATNAGQPRPMLKLGARRRDGGPPAWLLHVDPCQGCGTDQVCAAVAHLDALALSPDGEVLAVLIHQRGSQGEETLRVELLATERVAAAARAPASRATVP